jgi:hypothetical protein
VDYGGDWQGEQFERWKGYAQSSAKTKLKIAWPVDLQVEGLQCVCLSNTDLYMHAAVGRLSGHELLPSSSSKDSHL